MIERLQRALEHIEQVSPPLQADLAQRIEDLIGEVAVAAPSGSQPPSDPTDPSLLTQTRIQTALNLAGAWRDMPDTFDEMLDALDRLRHESPPSSAMDDQLAWLDDPAAGPDGEHALDAQDALEPTQ